MATLIPNRSSCTGRMTAGERRLSSRLEEKLDDDYLCWYDVPVGPHYRHPDFSILHPGRGILVLEVKDWKVDTIIEMDRDRSVIQTERGRVIESNPLKQARSYALEIVRVLQADPGLLQPEGSLHGGKLLMPWGFGVVLTNITRNQFDSMSLENFIPSQHVICRDEMMENVDPEDFQKRLWDMFNTSFPCQLTLPQIERVRWHLFPQLRIAVQGELIPPPRLPDAPLLAEIPDMIRIMDLQQEQLARSLGEGHRVIHGVAGSGKTMILGYRCLEMARRQHKPVLVLCYNKTLASRLEQLMVTHGVNERVEVHHFHGWCKAQLAAYAVRSPVPQEDAATYVRLLVETVTSAVASGAIPRAQYGAVMIDEGHDFAPEWLKLVTQMVDPAENSLLLLYDDAQTIYANGRKRTFSFASVGIQAQGRTTILRMNYRNTLEILATAKAFAEELLTAKDTDEDHAPVIAPERAGRRGPLPKLIRARSIWEEADIIAVRIRDAIAQGASLNDFAILCHSNQLATLIAEKLEKSGLPVVTTSSAATKRTLFDGSASIKVITMHSSKGLEFDTVFIPGICELANNPSMAENESLSHIRVLYVAMTRALRCLNILHHADTELTGHMQKALRQVSSRLAA